jgi:hypothetical protein
MHGYRMRSISSQPSSIIIGCSRTCLVGAGDHTPDRDHSLTQHLAPSRPLGLGPLGSCLVWCVKIFANFFCPFDY